MKLQSLLGAMALTLLCTACGGGNDGTSGDGGPMPMEDSMTPPIVFTMTNATTGNTVMAYLRSTDGTLAPFASVPTGGMGVGHGLENQGALALSQDGHFLYVVNPGSNDVTALRVTTTSVQVTDRVPSGGSLPVSVTEWNGVVYVLNRNGSAGPGSGPVIQGFRLSSQGMLQAIPGSTLSVRATDARSAQIAFSPDGLWLVITERGADQIDVIPLDDNYLPGTPRSAASAGRGPFGFAFSDNLRLYVSESVAGTTSAYTLDVNGTLHTLSAALSTQQLATCWLAITPDNKWVYVTNTSSSSISSYRVAPDGALTLSASVAASVVGRPIDAITDAGGDYLSVLTTDGSLETFLIDRISGTLSSIQTISGLPSGANGLTGH